MSTIFPLPSSPHWAPSTMTLFKGVRLLSSENQVLGVHDVRKLSKLREDVLGDGVVHVDERNGGSADLGPAQPQSCDVDPLLAQEGADPADYARNVLISQHQDAAGKLRHDGEGVDLDDPRRLAEHGAGNGRLPVPGHHGDLDETRVRLRLGG